MEEQTRYTGRGSRNRFTTPRVFLHELEVIACAANEVVNLTPVSEELSWRDCRKDLRLEAERYLREREMGGNNSGSLAALRGLEAISSQ